MVKIVVRTTTVDFETAIFFSQGSQRDREKRGSLSRIASSWLLDTFITRQWLDRYWTLLKATADDDYCEDISINKSKKRERKEKTKKKRQAEGENRKETENNSEYIIYAGTTSQGTKIGSKKLKKRKKDREQQWSKKRQFISLKIFFSLNWLNVGIWSIDDSLVS